MRRAFRIRKGRGANLLASVLVMGCGYRVQSPDSAFTLCVKAHASPVADAEAVEAVVAGVRRQLARAGVLGCSEHAVHVDVQLDELREEPTGLVTQGEGVVARGRRVSVRASASHLGRTAHGEATVTAAYASEAAPDVRLSSAVRGEAAFLAGEMLGRKLVGGGDSGEIPALPTHSREPLDIDP